MTYSEKLKLPQWQKRREEIRTRDNFTCQNCPDTKSTQNVHHWFYEPGKDPWDYPDWALSTFCVKCHKKAEKARLDLLRVLAGVSIASVHGFALDLESSSIASGKSKEFLLGECFKMFRILCIMEAQKNAN